MYSKKKKIVFNVLIGILLSLYLLIILIPILWFFIASVQPAEAMYANRPVFIFKPTLKNYITIFSQMHFGTFFLNSLIVCGFSTLIALIPGALAAYSFTRLKNKLTKNMSFYILSTRMMPPIAVIIPIYILMGKVRLLDTYIGLILMYMAMDIPYIVWMMMSFFEEIPKEIDESAKVDGCSEVGVLWRVVVPLAMPGVVATAVFVFVLSWSEFLFALILTSVRVKTLPVAISSFITDQGVEWGRMSAAGSSLILPLALMFYFIQKYLIRGLTFGAVKG